jgi:hypothetical protein
VALVLPRRADWLTAFFELLAHCLIARSAREERAGSRRLRRRSQRKAPLAAPATVLIRIRTDCGSLFVGMTGLTRQVVRSRLVQVYGVASCLMRSLSAGAG